MMQTNVFETATELVIYFAGSSALMLGAFCVVRVLRRNSAAVRHLVWMVAFVAMLLLPAARMSLPHRQIVVARQPSPVTPPAVEVPIESVQTPVDSASYEAVSPVTAASEAPQPMQAEVPIAPTTLPWPAIVGVLWLIGVLMAIVPPGIAVARLRRLKTRSVADPMGPTLLALGRRIGVRPKWLLRVNEEPAPEVAMTWGIKSATILLPVTSRSWEETRLEAVMLHELAHVRRRDAASQVLTAVVCALYWFNPLVWFGARIMRAEAECAADDLVLGSGVKPSVYAAELVRLAAELGRKKQPFPAVGVTIMKHSKIESRVVAILDSSRRRRGAGSMEAIGTLAAALALVIPCAVIKPALAAIDPVAGPAIGQDLADPASFSDSQADLEIAETQSQPALAGTAHVAHKQNSHASPHTQAQKLRALEAANHALKHQLQKQVNELMALREKLQSKSGARIYIRTGASNPKVVTISGKKDLAFVNSQIVTDLKVLAQPTTEVVASGNVTEKELNLNLDSKIEKVKVENLTISSALAGTPRVYQIVTSDSVAPIVLSPTTSVQLQGALSPSSTTTTKSVVITAVPASTVVSPSTSITVGSDSTTTRTLTGANSVSTTVQTITADPNPTQKSVTYVLNSGDNSSVRWKVLPTGAHVKGGSYTEWGVDPATQKVELKYVIQDPNVKANNVKAWAVDPTKRQVELRYDFLHSNAGDKQWQPYLYKPGRSDKSDKFWVYRSDENAGQARKLRAEMDLLRAQMQKMRAESHSRAMATDGQLKAARAELQRAMKMLSEERAQLERAKSAAKHP